MMMMPPDVPTSPSERIDARFSSVAGNNDNRMDAEAVRRNLFSEAEECGDGSSAAALQKKTNFSIAAIMHRAAKEGVLQGPDDSSLQSSSDKILGKRSARSDKNRVTPKRLRTNLGCTESEASNPSLGSSSNSRGRILGFFTPSLSSPSPPSLSLSPPSPPHCEGGKISPDAMKGKSRLAMEEKWLSKVKPRFNFNELSAAVCTLETKDLWEKFHDLETEMIITKTGRRMFPTMRVSFANLNSGCRYWVLLDIVPCDNKRYRYAYHKSTWLVAGKADPAPPHRLYVHPDSPFTEEQLSRQIVSFERIKLTNNESDKSGQIILNSMHRFQPRIHLVLRTDPNDKSPITNLEDEYYRTYVYPETVFTAVTAYQNQMITKLKIDSNPFAKGFRDSCRQNDYDPSELFSGAGVGPGGSMGSPCGFLPYPHSFQGLNLSGTGTSPIHPGTPIDDKPLQAAVGLADFSSPTSAGWLRNFAAQALTPSLQSQDILHWQTLMLAAQRRHHHQYELQQQHLAKQYLGPLFPQWAAAFHQQIQSIIQQQHQQQHQQQQELQQQQQQFAAYFAAAARNCNVGGDVSARSPASTALFSPSKNAQCLASIGEGEGSTQMAATQGLVPRECSQFPPQISACSSPSGEDSTNGVSAPEFASLTLPQVSAELYGSSNSSSSISEGSPKPSEEDPKDLQGFEMTSPSSAMVFSGAFEGH